MQYNGHLRTKLPRRRKAKDQEPRPVRGIVTEMNSTWVNTAARVPIRCLAGDGHCSSCASSSRAADASNDIRRGIPCISRTTLSERLQALILAGVVI
jgi:hypothetical protein